MQLAGFLFVNFLLFCAWCLWLARRRGAAAGDTVIYAGLLMACQIVLTEILLGMAGFLRLHWVLVATLSGSGVLTGWSLWRPRAAHASRWSAMLPRELWTPANTALLVLGVALTAWMLMATWLLPPRSVDDIAYHLPPLYQYVQSGRITLLPIELRFQFAMPLGGDFLFLWQLIFFHADTWVDGAQYAIAAWGVVVLYGLCREFAVPRRDAAFASGLLLFTPLVISQAGSNYVEVITAVCHLTLIYAVARFWREGSVLHLLMAGLASGFGLGVKYLMLIAIVGVQPIILLRLWRLSDFRAAAVRYGIYVAAMMTVPAYWLVRNLVVTGQPLFPYELTMTGLRNIAGGAQEDPRFAIPDGLGPALSHLLDTPGRILSFLLQEPGLGTVNGGLGIVFWGAGLPALIYCGAQSVRSAWRKDVFPALVWAQPLLVVLVFLYQTDLSRLIFNMRLILIVVPFALLALAQILRRLQSDSPGTASALRFACLCAAALVLGQVPALRNPDLDLSEPLLDRLRGRVTTPQHYYQTGAGALPSLRAAFEPLDYLTRDGPGWNVYMAADWRDFLTAPLFGSNLQNRVWNFQDQRGIEPDALVFHAGFDGGNENLLYVGGRITPEEVQGDDRYELIAVSPPTELWVRKELLLAPRVRTRLLGYYQHRFYRDIAALRNVIATLPAADAVVTSSELGHGLRFLALTGAYATPVHLSPRGRERVEARQLGATTVITLGTPISGARSQQVLEITSAEGLTPIIFNKLDP